MLTPPNQAGLIKLEKVGLELNHRVLLENISLELYRGDVLQIGGANGSGKSTLLKLLYGDHWHSSGQRSYYFTSQPRSTPIGAKQQMALVSPELQERYQRLSQDQTALEVLQTGFAQTDFLYSPLEPAQKQQALEFAQDLQISDLLEAIFTKLSKGQIRQVLLARALLSAPRLLLLDEFFSGIDALAQSRLRQIVQHFLATGGTLVYTTHRQAESFAKDEKKLFLVQGKMGQWLETKTTAKKSKPPKNQAQPNILIEIENADVYLGEPRDDATALDGHALSATKLVLEQINFRLVQGQHCLVTGQNGAGKSTFAKLLRGDLAPAFGGLVRWFGSSQTPIWQRQQKISLVSSDAQVWHRLEATGFEIVASGYSGGLGWHRPLEAVEVARVQELLQKLEIGFLEQRNALYASQGELRKLLLARALVTRPEVIILDEAFDYLDAAARALVWQVLQDQPATLLVIAHRQEDKPPFATQHLDFKHGRLFFSSR